MAGNGGDTTAATRVAAALGVLFFAAVVGATTVAPPPAAVTPNAATTSPGAATTSPETSRYFNPYPPLVTRAKPPSNPTDPPGSWELYPSPTLVNLHAVDFIDANEGWAVGYGVILKYKPNITVAPSSLGRIKAAYHDR